MSGRLRIAIYCLLAGAVGVLVGSRAWNSYVAVPPVAAAPALPAATVTQAGIQASFAPVVEKDLPAVVNISSSRVVRNNGNDLSPFLMDPFFRQFFGDDFGRQNRAPSKQVEKSLGSGVIVKADGYLLTNNHVIDGASEITVRFSNNLELKVELVGTVSQTAIVLLKVDANDLPVLTLADSSKVRVGDLVLAMGSPFGLDQTVTMGIISAKGRSDLQIEPQGYEDFIQTDAAINPGNSGGPLVDVRGQLIGINTAILTRGGGGNQGVGFAIPINMARVVMDQILEHGKVTRGYMGVVPQDVTPAIAQTFRLTSARGVLIGDVSPGSPAARAGFQRGDIILEMSGEKIEGSNQLRVRILQTAPGTTVNFKLLHDGAERAVSVKLAELPSQPQPGGSSGSSGGGGSPLDGVSVDDLNPQILRELRLPAATRGVVVTDVANGSPAAEAGLQSGDVIQEVDRTRITNVNDLDRVLRRAAGHNVLLLVNRAGNTGYIAIEAR
jgi:serine protease Do